jgi:hypothetical protein
LPPDSERIPTMLLITPNKALKFVPPVNWLHRTPNGAA